MKLDLARHIALKCLYKIDKEKAYSNIVLDMYLNENREKITNKDVNLISELVYGVTTWKLTIDYMIQKYSSIKLKKISDWVLNILRIGIYQIVFLDKIPKSAAVNESVNLCKKYANKSTSFVNAILRKIDKKDYEEIKEIKDFEKRISIRYSMPEWIVKKLISQLGENKAEEVCNNCNLRPVMSIRVNKLKISKEELKKKLNELNIETEDGILEDFLYIKNVKNIINNELYKSGFFTLQDEVAGYASYVLNPVNGEYVLDACSAPGGKTTYLAEIMQNEGEIIAWDLYSHRVAEIEENAKRLGINIIKPQTSDSTKIREEFIEKFDKILLDVPCLGLGVIRRKPDIKWQRQEKDIEDITRIQYDILETCSKYLKKGGELVYSTCSIVEEENNEIIEKFLKNNEFEVEKIDVKDFKNVDEKNNMLHFYPDNKTDGFFICKMRKAI